MPQWAEPQRHTVVNAFVSLISKPHPLLTQKRSGENRTLSSVFRKWRIMTQTYKRASTLLAVKYGRAAIIYDDDDAMMNGEPFPASFFIARNSWTRTLIFSIHLHARTHINQWLTLGSPSWAARSEAPLNVVQFANLLNQTSSSCASDSCTFKWFCMVFTSLLHASIPPDFVR